MEGSFPDLSPLIGSLSLSDYGPSLIKINQVHFAGAKDKVVPASVIRSYIDNLPRNGNVKLHVVPDFDHSCCWSEEWAVLVSKFLGDPY